MAKRMRRDRKKEAYWREHVRDQGRSGLTVRAYCQKHAVSQARFFWWKREVAKRDAEQRKANAKNPQPVAFAEIQIVGGKSDVCQTPRQSTGTTGIEVGLRGGRTIRVCPGFDESVFVRVVALLEGGRRC